MGKAKLYNVVSKVCKHTHTDASMQNKFTNKKGHEGGQFHICYFSLEIINKPVRKETIFVKEITHYTSIHVHTVLYSTDPYIYYYMLHTAVYTCKSTWAIQNVQYVVAMDRNTVQDSGKSTLYE